MVDWRGDILGEGFECCDIDLGSDDEGPLFATLVRSLPEPKTLWQRLTGQRSELEDVDVLYVHGWSDYFFQRALARFWTDRGARFFALDLRKYGRSLRPGQTPGYIESLDEYDVEIGQALRIMRGDGDGEDHAGHPRRLLLMGHSTGGLVLSLWADRNPGIASALVLNSPWLEFQLSGSIRRIIAPIVDLTARLNPRDAAPQFDYGFYTRAQREVLDPDDQPIDVNPEWRPDHSNTVSAGWLRAVLAGHSRVADGLGIDVPICTLLSKHFAIPRHWSDELTRADSVLEVDEIARAALKLGSSVTMERIDGAIHDVFLSRRAVREDAYARLARWLRLLEDPAHRFDR